MANPHIGALEEGPGRYRIEAYSITREPCAKWRVHRDAERAGDRCRSGVDRDAFVTLRPARIRIERAIEAGS